MVAANDSGTRTARRISVLFLCSANSCRSQIAEGLLRHFAGDRFEAASAGTHPTSLNPLAVEGMKEIGVDISAQHSKSVNEMLSRKFDYVITVCDKARELCPVFPSYATNLHWDLEDPAEYKGTLEEQRTAFFQVREKLQDLILKFVQSESR
jgi:arsenate reductase